MIGQTNGTAGTGGDPEGFLFLLGAWELGPWELPTLGALLLVPVLLLLVLVYKLVTRAIDRRVRLGGAAPDVYNGVKFILRIVWVVVVVVAIMGLLNVASEYALLISSVVASAVSFASITAINNFIAGLWIIFTRPFGVGDYVLLGENEGIVEEVSLNYTKIKHPDETVSLIPNLSCMRTKIVNYTLSKREIEDRVKRLEKIKARLEAAKKAVGSQPQTPTEQREFAATTAQLSEKDRMLAPYVREELKQANDVLKIFGQLESKRGKKPLAYSRYYERGKLVRYTFPLSLEKKPRRNAQAIEEACAEWTEVFEVAPRWRLVGLDSHLVYMFTIYTADPEYIVGFQSDFVKDIYRKVYGQAEPPAG